jgi:hypothetical protein
MISLADFTTEWRNHSHSDKGIAAPFPNTQMDAGRVVPDKDHPGMEKAEVAPSVLHLSSFSPHANVRCLSPSAWSDASAVEASLRVSLG